MEESLEQLKKHLFSMHRLSDDEWSDMSRIWQLHHYKRKTILTAAGETERHAYFVLNAKRGMLNAERPTTQASNILFNEKNTSFIAS